jgi:TrwC relaxase
MTAVSTTRARVSRRAGGSAPWPSGRGSPASLKMRQYTGCSQVRTHSPGEQRVAPLWRTDPRSRVDAGPLQAALRQVAASREVAVSELATGERERKRLQTISGTRKVSAVVADRMSRTVLNRNSEERYGTAIVEARRYVGKRIDARVESFDLSFSDPKSVSLLAAGSSPEVRAEVQAARHVAIRKVLGWLEQEAIGVRRGHNGADRLYHAALRAELTRRLDVRWRPVDRRTGAAEIEGLHDRNLLRAVRRPPGGRSRRPSGLAARRWWWRARPAGPRPC